MILFLLPLPCTWRRMPGVGQTLMSMTPNPLCHLMFSWSWCCSYYYAFVAQLFQLSSFICLYASDSLSLCFPTQKTTLSIPPLYSYFPPQKAILSIPLLLLMCPLHFISVFLSLWFFMSDLVTSGAADTSEFHSLVMWLDKTIGGAYVGSI